MDVIKYIKTLKRICETHVCSKGCPVNAVEGISCHIPRENDAAPEELVAVVEKWSKEHPLMTNRRKFEEVFGIDNQWIKTNFDGSMPTVTIPYSVITKSWWDAEYKGENRC